MSCRFVVLSDTHFTPPPSDYNGTWWNRSTERLSDRMGEALIWLVNDLAPDFVIHCGDFVGECSRGSFDFGAAVMDRLGRPWYAVTGNHDTWCSDVRDCFRETFAAGADSCSYTRELGGLLFMFLDEAFWYAHDGSISPVLDRETSRSGGIISIGPLECDLDRLETILGDTQCPAVLIAHAPVVHREAYPVVTLPHGKPVKGPMTKPETFIPDIIGHERLARITRDYPQLKACFSGHWHINDIVQNGGVWYIMTGALREFPYDVRLVDFNEGMFRITTHRLNVPDLIELSYVKEWGNRWVEGDEDARTAICRFR